MSDISSPDSQSDSDVTPTTCALCTREVEPTELRYINGRPACPECLDGVLRELANQRPQPISLLFGGVGGLIGALVGAAVWAVIAIATQYEIGFIAVLVGWLAGQGVKLAAGRARGVVLQLLAVVCAILGLVAAKYFIFTHFFSQGMAESHPEVAAGYLSLASVVAFFMNFSSFLSPFDILWVILAIGAAWSGPKEIRVVAG